MKNIIDKNIIILLVVLVVLIGFGYGTFVIPQCTQIFKKDKEIAGVQTKITDLTNKIKANDSSKENKPLTLAVYTSPYPGLDTENASVDLVDYLIGVVRETGNKIEEISFSTNVATPAATGSETTSDNTSAPATAAPAASASLPTNLGTLTLNLSLSSSYVSLLNLLQSIYTWKYLVGIKDLSIMPSQSNVTKLDIKLTVDLYIIKT